jgi:hypothetical protein
MSDAVGPLETQHEERVKAGALNGSVELNIDELRLEGFRAADQYVIAEAMQSELSRLLGQRGTPELVGQSKSVDRLDAGAIRVGAETRPGATGREIARHIHRSLIARPAR